MKIEHLTPKLATISSFPDLVTSWKKSENWYRKWPRSILQKYVKICRKKKDSTFSPTDHNNKKNENAVKKIYCIINKEHNSLYTGMAKHSHTSRGVAYLMWAWSTYSFPPFHWSKLRPNIVMSGFIVIGQLFIVNNFKEKKMV